MNLKEFIDKNKKKLIPIGLVPLVTLPIYSNYQQDIKTKNNNTVEVTNNNINNTGYIIKFKNGNETYYLFTTSEKVKDRLSEDLLDLLKIGSENIEWYEHVKKEHGKYWTFDTVDSKYKSFKDSSKVIDIENNKYTLEDTDLDGNYDRFKLGNNCESGYCIVRNIKNGEVSTEKYDNIKGEKGEMFAIIIGGKNSYLLYTKDKDAKNFNKLLNNLKKQGLLNFENYTAVNRNNLYFVDFNEDGKYELKEKIKIKDNGNIKVVDNYKDNPSFFDVSKLINNNYVHMIPLDTNGNGQYDLIMIKVTGKDNFKTFKDEVIVYRNNNGTLEFKNIPKLKGAYNFQF